MASLSSSLMELPAVSSLDFTHILPTTLKSLYRLPLPHIKTTTHIQNRVLIANIKNMGQCPCPRCTIKLVEVRDLGKAVDSQRRAEIRGPTRRLFRAVRKARKAIFKGFKVSGTRTERLLEGWSRVPTNVSSIGQVALTRTLIAEP